MEHQKITWAKALFFDAALAGGFQNLSEAAYTLLNIPLLLIDRQYNILFQQPNTIIWNESFDSLLGKKQLPTEARFFPHSQSTLRESQKDYGSSGIEEQCGDILTFPIAEGENLLAYLQLYPGTKQLTTEDIEIVQIFCRLIFSKIREFTYNRFTPIQQDLLDFSAVLKSSSRSAAADDALSRLQKRIPGPYQMLLSIPGNNGDDIIPPFFEDHIMKIEAGILAARYNGSVVILCGELPKKEISTGMLYPQVKAVVDFAQRCSLPVTLSLPFQRLEHLHSHYQQIYLSAKLASRLQAKDMVIPPERYMAYLPFLPAAEEYDAEAFLHPIILKILDWDRCYHTEYLKTLREYLLTGQKKKNTAQRLSIHQNTLLYRLSRINELLYVDFDDYDLMTVLLVNLMFLEVSYPNIFTLN